MRKIFFDSFFVGVLVYLLRFESQTAKQLQSTKCYKTKTKLWHQLGFNFFLVGALAKLWIWSTKLEKTFCFAIAECTHFFFSQLLSKQVTVILYLIRIVLDILIYRLDVNVHDDNITPIFDN